jgi:hypothetical protein
MASDLRIQEHLDQWGHNRAFLQEIPPKYPDWMVTSGLYIAIHAIEALLTADGAKERSRHQDRLQILQAEKRYEQIYKHFHLRRRGRAAHATKYCDPRRSMLRPGRRHVTTNVFPLTMKFVAALGSWKMLAGSRRARSV